MNNFWNTQSNFTLISLITFEIFSQTLHNLQGSRRNTIRWCLQNYMVNGWELTSELTSKWKTGKNDDKNAQRSVKTHCRQWVCGHCDCLDISLIFRLTTFDVRIRRQSHQKVQIGCFTSPSIRGISEKQSFLVYFQLGIISWKKKKKKTILGQCRCSVDNYSLNPGDLPCQF